MWKLFGPDSKLASLINHAIDLFLLGVIWILSCCTIIGIGPATAALYQTVTQCVRNGYGSPYRTFFRHLKTNWKFTVPAGLIFGVLLAAGGMIDLQVLIRRLVMHQEIGTAVVIFSFIKLFIIFALCLYTFPLLSRFQITVRQMLLLPLEMIVRYPATTICAMTFLITTLILVLYWPILLLFIPGFFCCLESVFLEPALQRICGQENLTLLSGSEVF